MKRAGKKVELRNSANFTIWALVVAVLAFVVSLVQVIVGACVPPSSTQQIGFGVVGMFVSVLNGLMSNKEVRNGVEDLYSWCRGKDRRLKRSPRIEDYQDVP